MAAVPFRLLNLSERLWLAHIVGDAAAAWQSAWLGESAGSPPLVNCHAACSQTGEDIDLDADWLSLSCANETKRSNGTNGTSGAQVCVHAPPYFLNELGALLVLPDKGGARLRSRPSSLLRSLARAALSDLLSTLRKSLPGQPESEPWQVTDDAPDPTCWRRGSGAAVLALSFGGLGCTVVVNGAGVLPALAHRSGATTAADGLVSRVEGLAPLRLSLQVIAGEASLALNELQTIVAGDVIKLDAPSQQPLTVINAEGMRLFGAYLGLRDGRKCIRLTR